MLGCKLRKRGGFGPRNKQEEIREGSEMKRFARYDLGARCGSEDS